MWLHCKLHRPGVKYPRPFGSFLLVAELEGMGTLSDVYFSSCPACVHSPGPASGH